MNCAKRLAALLHAWVPTDDQITVLQARGGPDILVAFRSVGRGVALVEEVDRTLSGLHSVGEDIDEWMAELPKWYEAVYSLDIPWQTQLNKGHAVLHPDSMRHLRTLGKYLEHVDPELPVSESDREQMRDLLDEVLELLTTTTELPRQQRTTIYGLVYTAAATLDDFDVLGSDLLQAQLAQVGLAVADASTHIDDPTLRARFQNLAATVWRWFSPNLRDAAAAAITTGGIDAIAALTQHL